MARRAKVPTLTGAASLDARFPGQWFQAETGLHYNWHRSYDPTLGRYTQPDPLGFVDGPSVYGYAGGSPLRWVDQDGRNAATGVKIGASIGSGAGLGGAVIGAIGGGAAGYVIGEIIDYCMAKPKSGSCSCSHRDTNTTTDNGQSVSCQLLRESGRCPQRYKGKGSNSAQCQANARDNAEGACKGCLGHCLFTLDQ